MVLAQIDFLHTHELVKADDSDATKFIVRSSRSRAADLRLIKSKRIWAKFDDFLWQCESFSYTVRLRKREAGFNGTSLTCETRWKLGNRSHAMFSGSNAIIWCERRQSCAVCYITMIITLSWLGRSLFSPANVQAFFIMRIQPFKS